MHHSRYLMKKKLRYREIKYDYFEIPIKLMSVYSFQHMIVGCARDIRGILLAFSSRLSYGMLFDWMYPLVVYFVC